MLLFLVVISSPRELFSRYDFSAELSIRISNLPVQYNSNDKYEFTVAGTNTFTCTFEEGDNSSCLLNNDNVGSTETWQRVDGRGVVADNTLNSGV